MITGTGRIRLFSQLARETAEKIAKAMREPMLGERAVAEIVQGAIDQHTVSTMMKMAQKAADDRPENASDYVALAKAYYALDLIESQLNQMGIPMYFRTH